MLFGSYLLLLFAYSLASRRLERSAITAPIVFTTAGMLVVPLLEGPLHEKLEIHLFLQLAEIGLVLLLFTDASRTELHILKSIRALPVRLLSTGMLLTILLGALLAKVIFPAISMWEAGILSAILAPTDAGLGQCVVNSPRVPVRIRQALNVEAGLNDGLSVPFLLFFIAIAAGAGNEQASLLHFAREQLGYGVFIGIGVAWPGGWLLGVARRKEWMAEAFVQVGVVALPVICILLSEATGASMFIAAFVAGLAVQPGFKQAGEEAVEFAEQWGQILNLSVFFLFGILVVQHLREFSLGAIGYALLSLTLVRMLPVAISLIGTGLDRSTLLFMGWFGPRGLASIVLGLVYLEQEKHLPGEAITRITVMATVLLSIFAHGLSAKPGIAAYARTVESDRPYVVP